MIRRETRCPVCLMPGVAVRADGTFAKHRSGHGLDAPSCAGTGRDATACLALDALGAAESHRNDRARFVADLESRLDFCKALAIRALDEEVARARDEVKVADTRAESLTLAALKASGWEVVETADGTDVMMWRDTHQPDREPVETAEALRLARKDAGRR